MLVLLVNYRVNFALNFKGREHFFHSVHVSLVPTHVSRKNTPLHALLELVLVVIT